MPKETENNRMDFDKKYKAIKMRNNKIRLWSL